MQRCSGCHDVAASPGGFARVFSGLLDLAQVVRVEALMSQYIVVERALAFFQFPRFKLKLDSSAPGI